MLNQLNVFFYIKNHVILKKNINKNISLKILK